VTFFFDACLSRAIPRILLELGVDARHLRDHFPEDAKDTEWIPQVGERGWVVVTVDNAIKKNSAERKALRDANVTAVFLGKWFLRRQRWEQAAWILKYWRTIEQAANEAVPGTILYVNSRCQFVREFA
jgi:hypothetical protein